MKKLSVLINVFAAIAIVTLAGCSTGTSGSEPEIVSHTIVFDSNGGSAVSTQTVNDGDTVSKPADPTNAPHNFLGWYKGESKYDFTAPVTSDVALKAKWTTTKSITYTVTVNNFLGTHVYVLSLTDSNTFKYTVDGDIELQGFYTLANGTLVLTDTTTYSSTKTVTYKVSADFILTNGVPTGIVVDDIMEIAPVIVEE